MNLPLLDNASEKIFALILPFLMVGSAGSFLVMLLQKLGFLQKIRAEGPTAHHQKENTPTAGGLVFLVMLILPCLYLVLVFFQSKISLSELCSAFALLLVALCSGLLGFWDDYLKKVKKQNEGLKPKQKLLAQLLLSLLLSFMLARSSTNFFGMNIELTFPLFFVFVFLVLAGSMNAANLTDGIDGLAASVMSVCFLGIFGISLLQPNQALSQGLQEFYLLYMLFLVGLCLGFYLLNKHPAKVFMGDTGSFFLGGALATLSLLQSLEWYLLFLAAVPILETVSVILQVLSAKLSRKFWGKDWRPFKMTPLHHHFELSGFSENQIVFAFAFVQFLINSGLLFFLLIQKP